MLTDEERKAARKLCDAKPPGPDEMPEDLRCGDGCEHIECGYVVRLERWHDQRRRDLAALLPQLLADVELLHGQVGGFAATVRHRGETIARLEAERDRAIGWRDEAMRKVELVRDELAPRPTEILNALKLWAAERREAETSERPDENVFKRVLVAHWDLVEAKLDELLAREPSNA